MCEKIVKEDNVQNKTIGKFTAKTFNNNFYEFEVKEDGYIYIGIYWRNKKLKDLL